MKNNLLTTAQAADELGVSTRQIVTMIQRSQLTAEKFGSNYAIKASDLEKVRVRPKGRPRKAKDASRDAPKTRGGKGK